MAKMIPTNTHETYGNAVSELAKLLDLAMDCDIMARFDYLFETGEVWTSLTSVTSDDYLAIEITEVAPVASPVTLATATVVLR